MRAILGSPELDPAALTFSFDDLQLGDPVDAVRESHRIAAVLLDNFTPKFDCVFWSNGRSAAARRAPPFAEVLLDLEGGHVAPAQEFDRLLAPQS